MLTELLDKWKAEEHKKSIDICGRYLTAILKKLKAEKISRPTGLENGSGLLVAIISTFGMGAGERLREITDENQLRDLNRFGMLSGPDYYMLTEKQVSIFRELLEKRIASSQL